MNTSLFNRSYSPAEKPAPLNEKRLASLLSLMKQETVDVNDKEICRRLDIFIQSVPVDLTEQHLSDLVQYGRILHEASVPESVMPFYRHYLFMCRRNKTAAEGA